MRSEYLDKYSFLKEDLLNISNNEASTEIISEIVDVLSLLSASFEKNGWKTTSELLKNTSISMIELLMSQSEAQTKKTA